MSADRETLLSCPFCGGEARGGQTSIDSDTQLELQCAGCGVQFVHWSPWTSDEDERAKAYDGLCKAWNTRSGSLIPRSEYERVLALLAEARPFVQMAKIFEERGADTTLSRIDDALAAQPEAKS